MSNLFSDLPVVIIEDTPTKQAKLDGLLEALGVEDIQSFDNGQEGLSALSQGKDKIILFLDLVLPEINGQEILQQLARSEFKGYVVINSVCERRIVQTAVNLAAASGIKMLGALSNDYSSKDLERMLMLCIEPARTTHRGSSILLSEEEIHAAFDQDLIEPFFQPIIHLESQTLKAVECLARIYSPEREQYLSPVSFLPYIEDTPFLDNLALRLYQKALALFKTEVFSNSDIKLSFNIEPSQLENVALAASLDGLTQAAQINPDRIIFELTEQSPISSSNQLETINILRLKGYNIAIDDFGSGHTNISNLHSIPFNRIKIDRHLIQHINEDGFCQIAVDAIMEMAQEVGAQVIFEGIENVEQIVFSTRHRDVYLQGYYFSDALPMNQLEPWLSKSPYTLITA